MASWQLSLAKLLGLLVLLPFAATYLHLYYYAYWQHEYCFVGPHVSAVSGRRYDVAAHPGGIRVAASNRTARDDDAGARFHGIYAPMPRKGKGGRSDDRRTFQQRHASALSTAPGSWGSFAGGAWPSVTQAAVLLSSPSSQLSDRERLRERQEANRNADRVLTFVEVEGEQKWCLQSRSSSPDRVRWCSAPLPASPEGTVHVHPPSGTWTEDVAAPSAPPVHVACPAPATAAPAKNKAGRHQRQNGKQNANLQFLLHHPATVALLLLNAGLCFYYWNHRVDPAAVAKQYTRIVAEHEWWRGLTGATAHFEPLHIGFNMMSLHTLGLELEGGYGSIVFLMYNVALVVFTTMVMMAMVYARVWWIQRRLDQPTFDNPHLQQACRDQQQRLRKTSSVGYSAVLFAWMVISTMERQQPTCPVPFFSDVCFSTYSGAAVGLPFLRFNISPIVSLFIAQFIMPRVSFMGHLAGIVCGFCLHWGWTAPPLEVCSTNVLIGGVFLAGLRWRNLIPVRPLLTASMDEEGRVEHDAYLSSLLRTDDGEAGDDGHGTAADPFTRSKHKKKERLLDEFRRKQKTLLSLRSLLGIVLLLSLWVFRWTSSLVLSQCLLLAYFTCGARSSFLVWAYIHDKASPDVLVPEQARSGAVWRGFFVAAALAIVVDSMSLAAWCVMSALIAADRRASPVGLLPAAAFMLLRIAVNGAALIVASKILHDNKQVGDGIFVRVFSLPIKFSKTLGDQGVFLTRKPLLTAFEGRGITLGGGR